MLKLNVNEEKQLTFEFKIDGISPDLVSSFLRMSIDNVEYGFPASIKNESIVVDLPALKNVTNRRLREGSEVEVRLDVVADGTYTTPWKDTFKLSNPVTIEAKIMDANFTTAPTMKTKITSTGKTGEKNQGVVIEKIEEKREVKQENLEADMTEKIVSRLTEKFSHLLENKMKPQKVSQETRPIKKLPIKESKVQPVKKVKNQVTPQQVRNITKEEVYEYMKRAGTKSEHIQEILYEQAERMAGTSKPVEVLKQIVKVMKRQE
jgi:hypothetical protein